MASPAINGTRIVLLVKQQRGIDLTVFESSIYLQLKCLVNSLHRLTANGSSEMAMEGCRRQAAWCSSLEE